MNKLGLVCASFQEKNLSNVREIYLNRECANLQEKSFFGSFFFFFKLLNYNFYLIFYALRTEII